MNQTLSHFSNSLYNTFNEVEQGGRAYVVVKGVPLVEGVLNKRFVSKDEFGSFVNDWNDLPLVLRHPKQNGGTARVPSPDVPVIGRFHNAEVVNDKLVGEYWFDKDLLLSTDEGIKIYKRIKDGEKVETSTGYWSVSRKRMGKHNDKDYELVDMGIHPDHIAVLPDEEGACSVHDGCGINRNSKSCNCEHSQLSQNHFPGQHDQDNHGRKGRSLPKIDSGRNPLEKNLNPLTVARQRQELFKIEDQDGQKVKMVHKETGEEHIVSVREARHRLFDLEQQEGVSIWDVEYVTPILKQHGGPGSGNEGHAGRPGKVGGSAPANSAQTRENLTVLSTANVMEKYNLREHLASAVVRVSRKIRNGAEPSEAYIDVIEDENLYGVKPVIVSQRERVLQVLKAEGIEFDDDIIERYEVAQEDEIDFDEDENDNDNPLHRRNNEKELFLMSAMAMELMEEN